MLDWMNDNGGLMWWMLGVSVLTIVGSVLIAPALIVNMPPDYFTGKKRPEGALEKHHPAIRITLLILKNILGYIFVLAGLAMLALPGQGLITIFLGIILIDFPGKYRFQKWLVCRKPVRKGINWLRRKRGREEMSIGC